MGEAISEEVVTSSGRGGDGKFAVLVLRGSTQYGGRGMTSFISSNILECWNASSLFSSIPNPESGASFNDS